MVVRKTHPSALQRTIATTLVLGLALLPRPVAARPATRTATSAADGLLGMGRLTLSPEVVYAATSTGAVLDPKAIEPYLGFGRRDADLLAEILTVRVPELVEGLEGSARIIRTLSAELDVARAMRNNALAQVKAEQAKADEERATVAKLNNALVEAQEAATIKTGVSIAVAIALAAAAFAIGYVVAK